ncbi:MAG: hypothetical protein HY731_03705 [Candidatus Tectomicrobia bacterium]|nr:hypothetical protein [Candidatus Tectomicrobia bacterium]
MELPKQDGTPPNKFHQAAYAYVAGGFLVIGLTVGLLAPSGVARFTIPGLVLIPILSSLVYQGYRIATIILACSSGLRALFYALSFFAPQKIAWPMPKFGPLLGIMIVSGEHQWGLLLNAAIMGIVTFMLLRAALTAQPLIRPQRKRIPPGRMLNHIGLGIHFVLLLLLDYAGIRYTLKHQDLKLLLLLLAFNLVIFFSFYYLLLRSGSKASDEWKGFSLDRVSFSSDSFSLYSITRAT